MSRPPLWIAFLLTLVSAAEARNVPRRYIVELETEPVAEHVSRLPAAGRLQSAAALAHRARVRSEQTLVRARLELRQAKVLESIDTVANALLVEIPDELAGQLASTPGVRRVVPVRWLHMVLDRAVVEHKVVEAWNQIGSDRAGAGVRIAIIDSGIDSSHPGFRDTSLVPPDSFPRANTDSDLAYTNGKIIVARSYVSLLPNRDPDMSARDHMGHGTALAMISAGVQNVGPRATLTGVAPRAWLGNYKVFGSPGVNDSTTDAALLKALDDAVADGMDIVNFSLGDDLAPRLSDDLDVQAIERASQAGVIVVAAAGNNGPDLNTMSSPATAPSAIAVGATTNDRTFAASVDAGGPSRIVAIVGIANSNIAALSGPVAAPIRDVAALDGTGLACASLPLNSLAGRIALILRGSCTFETKLNNAQQAGAVAALVYATADAPDPFTMALGAATIPAEMVSNGDGVSIQGSLASQPALAVTLDFSVSAVPVAGGRLTDFTAAGPNVDAGIKPDLTAVGADFYVATQTLDPAGEMYDATGYTLVDGTSFSTPMVAGAAALIKSARPGLTVDQYRSLLINTAAPVQTHNGQTPAIQQAGAGWLDVSAALNSTAAAYPTALSFGVGGTDANIQRSITITNVGAAAESFTIGATSVAGAPVPAMSAGTVDLAVGASVEVPVSWQISGVEGGTYEGFITVAGAPSGTRIRIPYWYAASSGAPAHVGALYSVGSGRRGSSQPDAVLFRITDVSGVALTDVQPSVTVVSGGGQVRRINSYDSEVPGLFGVDVRLGSAAGSNVFRIQAGAVKLDVTIAGL